MKHGSRSRQSESANRRYAIGSVQTPIGPASVVVWSNDVVGIVHGGRHAVGIKIYKSDTLWVSDTDPEVQKLLRDRARNGGMT